MVQVLLGVSTFLLPFYIIRYDLFGIPTNVFEFGVLLIFLIALREIARNNQANKIFKEYIAKFSKTLIASVIIFIISSFIGIWRAGFTLDSFGIVKSWVIVPMIFCFTVGFFVFNKKNNDKYILAINYGLLSSLIIVSLWAVFQRLGIIGAVLYQSGDGSFGQYLGDNFRAFGPFESPNYLAMYIVPLWFIIIGTMQKAKSKKLKVWNGIFYLSLILPAIALILTKSRAGLIALAVSLSFLGFAWLYKKLKTNVAKIALTLSCLILYSVFFILVYKFGMRPETDSMRFEIYRYSWQMIKENPIWGVGLSNFQNHLSNMPLSDSFRQIVLPYAYHPHNLYFALWLNFGLLGLIAFMGIVALTICNIIKSKNVYSILITAAMISVLIHGIFDTTYFKNDLSTIFWLIVASSYLILKESKEKNS